MIINEKSRINKENEAINGAVRVDKVTIIIKINSERSEVIDIMSPRGQGGINSNNMLKSRTTISSLSNSLTTGTTSQAKNIMNGKMEIKKNNKTNFKAEINQSLQIKNKIH